MVDLSSWRTFCLYCRESVSIISLPFLFLLLFLSFLFGFSSLTIAAPSATEACPYGYGVIYNHGFTCSSSSEPDPGLGRVLVELERYSGACNAAGDKIIWGTIPESQCARTPNDHSGEDGCYPAQIDPLTGFCQTPNGHQECQSSGGQTFILENGKSCENYCEGPGTDPLTGDRGKGVIHACNENSYGEPLSSTGDGGSDPGSCPPNTIRVGDNCVPLVTDPDEPGDGGGDTGGGDTGGGDTGGGDTGGGDTGGGDSGGGDTGGGDSGGGDTGGEIVPGSCPIGSTTNPLTGICEPDDCQPGYYMTSLGCQAIPEPPLPPPPPENGEEPQVDLSGVIEAINEQTQQLRTDNQAQTTNIANAEKAAADQITKAIKDGVRDITGAIGDIPGGGGGGGSGTTPGEGEEEPGGACDPEKPDYLQCLQKTSLPGAITDGGSFGGSGQAFYDRVANAPLVRMGDDFAQIFDIDRADCPSFSIDLPAPINRVVSTTLHCDLMNQISGIISAVMLIIYAFYGIRIIMSS